MKHGSKDFMTKCVVYVSPETTVAAAADIMRERFMPAASTEHDKLVGLVTEGTMAEASLIKSNKLVNLWNELSP